MVGGAVVLAGLRALGAVPTPGQLAGWLVLLASGLAVTWASRVLVASLTLWAPGVELDVVYGALWQFGRYPVSIYRQPLRFALTYVLPIVFISTFPAQALTRDVDPSFVLGGAAVGAGAITLVRLIGNGGLRRYTSATS